MQRVGSPSCGDGVVRRRKLSVDFTLDELGVLEQGQHLLPHRLVEFVGTHRRVVSDRRRPRGRCEHALLLFLYNTGARVSEATELVAGDLKLARRDGGHALVTIHGKGGKRRQCPLWPRTEGVLGALVQGRGAGDAVFLSRQRRPYTRFGVYRLVERCAARVPALAGRTITPHVIRHSSACHLLQAGVDLNTIRAWLGHASLDTTNIYAEIDLEMKAKAMALCDAAEPGPVRPWKENKGLMAFLGAL